MTPGMRACGKALTHAHDYARKGTKKLGRKAVRRTLKLDVSKKQLHATLSLMAQATPALSKGD